LLQQEQVKSSELEERRCQQEKMLAEEQERLEKLEQERQMRDQQYQASSHLSGRIEYMRCELLRLVICSVGVCQSVSLSVTRLRCVNTAKRIDVLLRVETLEGQRNI